MIFLEKALLIQIYEVYILIIIFYQIKTECEKNLVNFIDEKSYEKINKYANIYNAPQLRRYCQWFHRRMFETEVNEKELAKR